MAANDSVSHEASAATFFCLTGTNSFTYPALCTRRGLTRTSRESLQTGQAPYRLYVSYMGGKKRGVSCRNPPPGHLKGQKTLPICPFPRYSHADGLLCHIDRFNKDSNHTKFARHPPQGIISTSHLTMKSSSPSSN